MKTWDHMKTWDLEHMKMPDSVAHNQEILKGRSRRAVRCTAISSPAPVIGIVVSGAPPTPKLASCKQLPQDTLYHGALGK
jgi:hypothetical protein